MGWPVSRAARKIDKPSPGATLAETIFPASCATGAPRGNREAAELCAVALVANAMLDWAASRAFDAQSGPGEGFGLVYAADMVRAAIGKLVLYAIAAANDDTLPACAVLSEGAGVFKAMDAEFADFAAGETFGEFRRAAGAVYLAASRAQE